MVPVSSTVRLADPGATRAARLGYPRGAVLRWCLPAVGAGRIAWLRVLIYLVVAVKLEWISNTTGHGTTPQLFDPVVPVEVLGLPAPTVLFLRVLRILLIAGALVGVTGRFPRLAGWPVAVMFLLWDLYEMSYGKVDHDEFAMIVALFLLPTLGRVRFRDTRPTEAAGFAVRGIQVAVVCTYFLAAYAKIRFGTWNWPNGALFVWALSRRGYPWSRPLMNVPGLLHASQWLLITLETLSPIMLFVGRRLAALAACGWLLFHLMTYATIGIHFLPTAVCLFAFLPLEEIPARLTRRRAARASVPA